MNFEFYKKLQKWYVLINSKQSLNQINSINIIYLLSKRHNYCEPTTQCSAAKLSATVTITKSRHTFAYDSCKPLHWANIICKKKVLNSPRSNSVYIRYLILSRSACVCMSGCKSVGATIPPSMLIYKCIMLLTFPAQCKFVIQSCRRCCSVNV